MASLSGAQLHPTFVPCLFFCHCFLNGGKRSSYRDVPRSQHASICALASHFHSLPATSPFVVLNIFIPCRATSISNYSGFYFLPSNFRFQLLRLFFPAESHYRRALHDILLFPRIPFARTMLTISSPQPNLFHQPVSACAKYKPRFADMPRNFMSTRIISYRLASVQTIL